ncbi:EPIDERMAL PATTERNING FACTOR-like protein 3 [Linum perenne]
MDAKTISCSLLLLALQMSLVLATSRSFPPNHASAAADQPVISQSHNQQASQAFLVAESTTHLSSTQDGIKGRETERGGARGGIDEAAYFSRRFGKLGSSPPSCEHKCYGCSPCEAIQVPTTSRRHSSSHALRLNYSNYEPEGWKCKCGPSFYSP